MSIAGIAKEVTTISVSAWFFGDQLSPLNITGAAITVCGAFSRSVIVRVELLGSGLNKMIALGICLFTYHKYRKSIDSTVPLDAHGNPIVSDEALGSVEGFESRPGSVEEMQPLAEMGTGPRQSLVCANGLYLHLLGTSAVAATSHQPSTQDERILSADSAGGDVLFDMSADDVDAKSLTSQFVREEARRMSYEGVEVLGTSGRTPDRDSIR